MGVCAKGNQGARLGGSSCSEIPELKTSKCEETGSLFCILTQLCRFASYPGTGGECRSLGTVCGPPPGLGKTSALS